MPFTLPTLAQKYLEQSGLYNDYINPWLRQNVPGTAPLQDWAQHGYQVGPNELITTPQDLTPLTSPNMRPAWLTHGEETGEFSPIEERELSPVMEPALLENPALAGVASEEGAKVTSPIARGVEEARRTPLADRYAASPEQKREALGHALMAFAGQMGASTKPSQLGAMVEGLNPALQAFTAQKQRAEEFNRQVISMEQQAANAEADRAYKEAMLGLHREELEFKKNKAKFNELTPVERSRISGNFQKRYIDLMDAKRKEYKEATEHIRGTSDAAEAKRDAARKKVDQRWARPEQSLTTEMNKFGLAIGDILPDEVINSDVVEAQIIASDKDSITVKVNGNDVVVNDANFESQPEAVKEAIKKYMASIK